MSSSSDGTRLRNWAHEWLNNADNHKAFVTTKSYVNAGYCFAGQYLTCSQAYYEYASVDSYHTNTARTWVTLYHSAPVSPQADYARAVIYNRLDIPWRWDPWSNALYTAGMKY